MTTRFRLSRTLVGAAGAAAFVGAVLPAQAQEAAPAAETTTVAPSATVQVTAAPAPVEATAAPVEATAEVPAEIAAAPTEEAAPVEEAVAVEESVAFSADPADNTFEIGGYFGGYFPSKQHGLRGDDAVAGGNLGDVALDLGARLGYYPLSFLGAEAELGVMVAREYAPDGMGDGGAVLYTGRAHLVAQLPVGPVTPFILGGVGALGIASDQLGNDVDLASHIGVGVKHALSEDVTLRFDGRDVLTTKLAGAKQPHNFEILMGLSYVIRPETAPPPVLDRDGDGVPDASDQCPDVAGDAANGCLSDRDGDGVPDSGDACPDVAGDSANGCLADRDGDGVPDATDQCPDVAGTTETGCLPDGDGDGVPDAADQCPDVKGDNAAGCLNDADADGVPDVNDKCPDAAETKNGFEDEDGCPDELPKEVAKFSGVIEGILFESGSEVIKVASKAKLDQAAKVLTDYPALRLKVSGHTDSTGDHDKNVELSLKRAESVKAYLVEKGVAAERVVTEGLGPDQPVADNKTVAGRGKNRRIEFSLIQK